MSYESSNPLNFMADLTSVIIKVTCGTINAKCPTKVTAAFFIFCTFNHIRSHSIKTDILSKVYLERPQMMDGVAWGPVNVASVRPRHGTGSDQRRE